MMDRRAFVAGTLTLVAAPLAAGAQPTGSRPRATDYRSAVAATVYEARTFKTEDDAVRVWGKPTAVATSIPPHFIFERPGADRVVEITLQFSHSAPQRLTSLIVVVRPGFDESTIADWFGTPRRITEVGDQRRQYDYDGADTAGLRVSSVTFARDGIMIHFRP
jgi:hypothetical protein